MRMLVGFGDGCFRHENGEEALNICSKDLEKSRAGVKTDEM